MVAEPGAGGTVAGLGPLSEAYGNAIGRRAEFFIARSYAELIDAHVSGRIDYAIYSASAYASAWRRCECVEPLAAPTGEDGSVGIRSVLVARDGRLPSDGALAGRRIGLLQPDSIAGHQLPLASFRPGGRPLTGSEDFFVRVRSAEEAEAMLVAGDLDAIFGWSPVLAPGAGDLEGGTVATLVAAGLARSSLEIIWRFEPLRYGPHAVSIGLDAAAKRKLTTFLVGLRQADPDRYELLDSHRLGGFVPATHADYAAAVDLIGAIGGTPPDAGAQAD